MTEAFCALLEVVDGLAGALVAHFELPVRGDLKTVATQVPAGGLGTVDLQLEFDQLVWVEIKHGADLGERQLARYRAALDQRQTRRDRDLLVLLAPQGFGEQHPEDVAPADRVIDWQEVGLFLRGWHHRADLGPRNEWLVKEFIEYLHEEELAVTDALTADHLTAVVNREGAATAFQYLLIQAHEQIKQASWELDETWPARWPEITPSRSWPDFWATFIPPQRCWGHAVFEWNLGRRDFCEGELLFGAGLTVFEEPRATVLSHEAWLDRLEADPFGFVCRLEDKHWRLFRYLEPAHLVKPQADLTAQISRLAAWVLTAFGDLAENAPTPSMLLKLHQ